MNSNGNVNSGGFNLEMGQIELSPQVHPLQAPHQPGVFRSLLAGAASIAGNMFAPGLGSAIGSLIGGGSTSGMATGGYAANAANLAQAQELLAVAAQANRDQEGIELASNLQKSKHEAFMAVIQNIGS